MTVPTILFCLMMEAFVILRCLNFLATSALNTIFTGTKNTCGSATPIVR